MWTEGVPIDENTLEQVRNIAGMPFIFRNVAVMPDAHLGKGATVGTVLPTRGAVIPAAVGVDIGCGMEAVRTPYVASDLPDNLASLRSVIEQKVPHGRSNGGRSGDKGSWKHVSPEHLHVWATSLAEEHEEIAQKHPQIRGTRTVAHLGTLGGGNHFIEICLDERDRVWIMLHSGSRGVGNRIGTYFIEIAKKDMRELGIELVDTDLAYLQEGTTYFDDYMQAVGWAQKFARINRHFMVWATIAALRKELRHTRSTVIRDFEVEAISCHHNYVQEETHFGENVIITRKGAVCAAEGVMGIIPGSMGAKSFIVRGKGNPLSFNSCSHGAGRVMSRTKAKKLISLERHVEMTQGIECTKDESVLDESPDAYKDIDAVMAAQADLVEVVHTLRQVVCVKGGEGGRRGRK